MSDSTDIRRALPSLQAAQDLLAVEACSLKDSGYRPHAVADLLAAPGQRIYLAYVGGRPSGFCACFATTWRDGPQLEVDALGVVPAARGRGVATALVRRALDEAEADGITRGRAVVRVDNLASAGVFRRLAWVPEAQTREMMIYDVPGRFEPPAHPAGWSLERVAGALRALPEPGLVLDGCGAGHEVWLLRDEQGRLAAAAESQQVRTLSYTGLWLEALWARTQGAQGYLEGQLAREAAGRRLDEIGYLLRSAALGERAALVRRGWLHAGRYRIWSRL